MSDTTIQTTTFARIDHKGATEAGVRVMGSSPERSAIQIRSFGTTTSNGGGKVRPVYSHAYLSIEQIEELIVALEAERTRLVFPL